MSTMEINARWAALVNNGFFSDFTYEARRRYQKSSAALRVDRSAWILEVATGSGRYVRLLKELGYQNVVSVDLTVDGIARARQINPDGLFAVAAAEKLPFKANIFDAVVSNAAVEHYSDQDKGVDELTRVAAKDAQVVLTSDCYSWRILQMMGLYRSTMPVDRTRTYGGFKALFERHDLKLEYSDAWGLTQWPRMASRVLKFLPSSIPSMQNDDFWANVPPGSEMASSLRMMFMDENLFALKNTRGEQRPAGARPKMRLEDVLDPSAPYTEIDGIKVFTEQGSVQPRG